jgi:hypothetical protein
MAEITLEYVESLATQLPVAEQKQLIEHLESRLQAAESATGGGKQLRSLRGIWRGKFPEDLDVEKEIRAIRDEWKQDFEEFGL